MRALATLSLLLFVGGCSDLPPLDVAQPPNPAPLKSGIVAGINDSHFSKPIEVTDVLRAPANMTPQWMVCLRSATSDEAKRRSYSVFYGKEGTYVSSRYSVSGDNCSAQPYHPYE
jgi:hypothetical protein